MRGGRAGGGASKSVVTQQLEAETRAMEMRLRGLKEERDKLLSKIEAAA